MIEVAMVFSGVLMYVLFLAICLLVAEAGVWCSYRLKRWRRDSEIPSATARTADLPTRTWRELAPGRYR